MARMLDQMVVVDIEATCWEGAPPEGQEQEIIEIGVCLLDVASGQRLEKQALLVKPQRSLVSSFCTQLTTLTQAQVDQGMAFAEACELLRTRYASKERIWASYGDFDRSLFESQCKARGVDYPFGKGHINIKTLLALVHALPREIGLVRAMDLLKMPLEGTHHRGVDDAWNIAGILATILLRARG